MVTFFHEATGAVTLIIVDQTASETAMMKKFTQEEIHTMKNSDMVKEQPAIIFFSMWAQMYSLIAGRIKSNLVDVKTLAEKIEKLKPEEALWLSEALS